PECSASLLGAAHDRQASAAVVRRQPGGLEHRAAVFPIRAARRLCLQRLGGAYAQPPPPTRHPHHLVGAADHSLAPGVQVLLGTDTWGLAGTGAAQDTLLV